MILQGWYPVQFFRISFGKQDQLRLAVATIDQATGDALSANSSPKQVLRVTQRLLQEQQEVVEVLQNLSRYVPYRFLQAFFPTQMRGVKEGQRHSRIVQLAAEASTGYGPLPMYTIHTAEQHIVLQEEWRNYLFHHLWILRDFCLWQLLRYLQRRNPNVPNLNQKLLQLPGDRQLTNQRKMWRKIVQQQAIDCIFSQQPIGERFDVDHYLPWSFVYHDQFWNLIPTLPEANRSKSNLIPGAHFFNPFSHVQYRALRYLIDHKP